MAPAARHLPTAPSPFIEQQRQQERERALRERNERPVSERPPAAIALEVKRIPPESESPCLRFDRIALVGEGAESFQWSIVDLSGPQGDDSPLGRCLGVQGLDVVTGRAQQALIQRGFVTTRALAQPQDLVDGVFTITLIPGRITAIRLSPDSSARVRDTPILAAAIPAEPGDLLNTRDVEQGLENLKRASTADADIRIQASAAPDAGPGDSELVVRYVQPRILRATVSLDDSGTEATGKYQGSLTLSADNPLGLNDLFYLSLNHNLASHPHKRGTEGQTWHYSVPRGYWLFGVTASDSSYFQGVAGANQDYVYGGASTHYEAKLSRLIHRDQQRKLGVYLRGFQRASSNRIDDTEIEVQRRKVGGWEFGLNHREFLGRATLDGTLAYRRGTGAFGAIAAPEESFGEGSARFKLYTAELGLNAPFKLGEQKMRYSGLVRSQWNRTPLTPQDRFAIGSALYRARLRRRDQPAG